MQQGMLLHSLLEPGSGVYVQQLVCDLQEEIHWKHFRQAWQAIVNRHAALRTGFRWEEPEPPRQVVQPPGPLDWETLDWSGIGDEEWNEKLHAFLDADRQRGFELGRGPWLRWTLLKRGESDHCWVWTSHHALLDGRSYAQLLREGFEIYDSLKGGLRVELPPGREFSEHVDWLARQDFQGAEPFWRERLAGFPMPTALPLERNGAGEARKLGRQQAVQARLPAGATAALEQWATSIGVTLNTLVQAAWALLLARYQGGTCDVVFGAARACRRSGIAAGDNFPGMFVNTLPVRVQVEPGTELIPWLQALREQWNSQRKHEHVPLDRIRDWAEVPRNLPLFESLVVFEHAELDAVARPHAGAWPGRRFQLLGQPGYALNLLVHGGAHLAIKLAYDPDRFDAVVVARMLGHYCTLLEGFTSTAHRLLGELPLLTPRECRQLTSEWQGPVLAPSPHPSLYNAFARQAATTPGTVALIAGIDRITYEQLATRANRVAHRLRALGVGPEVRVALCAERSAELVVGVLGILAAGGAYVPLDPQYPADRIRFMLEDSGATVLLTQAHLRSMLPPDALAILTIEEAEAATSPKPPSPLADAAFSWSNLAYVIYTSGSTGRPKGVAIEHRQALSFVEWARMLFTDAELAGVLFSTSICFDLSVFELFVPLCTGGTVVLSQNALELPQLAAAGEVTLVNTVPSVLRELLEMRAIPAGVRVLNLAGEPLPTPLVDRAYGLGTVQKVNDLYGPSETTTYSTWIQREAGKPATIGRPIANTQVYVVDDGNQLLPVGVPGELLIGGAGVARGYLNRPELTASRFIPDPFNPRPDARLYRTGDRACWRSDGTLELLGRVDHQVKVRGFRIEPGEIESLLGRHPSIHATVVVAREVRPGDLGLVAYCVPRDGSSVDPQALKAHLQGALPDVMIPTIFVSLERLPLTPNGKVDRKALPAPAILLPQPAGVRAVSPCTPLEELIAGIWGNLLGVQDVGVEDNFFEIGGHSLLAARVMARLRRTLEVDLPLRSLFDHPTVAAFARALDAHKRGHQRTARPGTIPRTTRDSRAPLSMAQQRLWFLDRLDGGSPGFHMPEAFRIRGPLDVVALEQAIQAVVTRHETLRTRFPEVDGEPVQCIEADTGIPLILEDLSGLEPTRREAAIREALERDRTEPFDLTRGPLLRVRLLKLGDGDHLFLRNCHHIISDGWSRSVFNRELGTHYKAIVEGAPAPLPDLPVQFADYASWQRQWMSGAELERQHAYWRAALEGAVPLSLPTDRPHSARPVKPGGTHRFKLPASLAAQLRRFNQDEGVTPFMTLLAAFQVLLSRYSGQEDIVVGTPIADRSRVELEPLIGYLLSTLVLRLDLSGQPSFREMVARVRRAALDAYEHSEPPFEILQASSRQHRDLTRHPVFQVLFVLQNTPVHELNLPAVDTVVYPQERNATAFDLSLEMVLERGGWTGCLVYDAHLFDAATIERMAGHYATFLDGALSDPDRAVFEVPMLTAEEHRQLTGEWSRTSITATTPGCVHELFEEQARRTPEAVALVAGGGTLTYGELLERSGQLSRRLQRLGVGPDTLVALLADRSPEMIVGILGILRAGGAYVPLDPRYPNARLLAILDDARPTVGVYAKSAVPTFGVTGCDWIRLETGEDEVVTGNTPRGGSAVSARNLAYVLHTSGSTGNPKGVMVEHRSLVNFVRAAIRQYGIRAGDRVLQFASLCFDASAEEIFPCLAGGATLVLRDEEMLRSATAFLAQCDEWDITVLDLPTAYWAELAAEAARDGTKLPGSIREVIIGGERAQPRSLDAWRRIAGAHVRLINTYGPTETTIVATWHVVDPLSDSASPEKEIPIGRPVDNARVYVLDTFMQPVPTGLAGELYVGGMGVARGYLNLAEATAERFVPDPFGENPEARLYRTGDVCRHRADGLLEFVGRADRQVKVRGFRVELGEIEAHLGRHPMVARCAVVDREEEPGGRRLVAFIVPTSTETAPGTETLRRWLGGLLPAHMVPSEFVLLDRLPVLPNGKIDLGELRGRKVSPHPSSRPSYSVPTTPMEDLLLGIWREVLRVPGLGVEDDFFERGGHSLLAARVVARIRKTIDIDLSLRSLFEHPTVRSLARFAVLLGEQGDKAGHHPPLRPMASGGVTQLSFPQQRLWFLDRLQGGTPEYLLPEVFQIVGPLNAAALEQAINHVVERHDALRTHFVEVEGEPFQSVQPRLHVELPVEDLSNQEPHAREEAVRRAIDRDRTEPFDLNRAPLLRARLLRLAKDEHLFLRTFHHIVSDGWSLGVFNRELEASYRSFSSGAHPALEPLSVQYPDYATWQREWLQGPELERQLSFWRKTLINPPILELPTDRPRPSHRTNLGRLHRFRLSERTGVRLQQFNQAEGATPFMSLLAAFQVLLSRYSNQEDILVGTPIANRRQVELESLIGFLANTLVIRLDLSGNPNFSQVVARARKQALDAFDHQDLPFEKLVEALNPTRDPGRQPLFQVLFALQNAPAQPLSLDGLRVHPMQGLAGSTHFDLELQLWADGNSWSGFLAYDADLFHAESIERMAGHFEVLLEGLLSDPGLAVVRQPLLDPAGLRQLLAASHPPQVAHPCSSRVHEWFTAQAGRTPAETAVRLGTSALSFAELNAQANRLAHRLRASGATTGSRIGIFVPRSLELPIAVLAILKAGGACVPLDPGYPTARLEWMLKDAALRWIVCGEAPPEFLRNLGAELISVKRTHAETHAASEPRVEVEAESPAYVLFTSGSTGRPKGVEVPHRTLENLVAWQVGDSGCGVGDPTLQFASLSFDVSFQEMFATWASGGTLVLVHEDTRRDFSALARLVRDEGIVRMFLPMIALDTLAEELGAPEHGRLALREIITAGEQLRITPAIRSLFQRLHGGVLVNQYGPTETHVATFHRLEGSPDSWPAFPPIGRPIANLSAYVLNPSLQLMPPGIPGELFLGGDGLALGYLNRPDLTAERFLPNPFAPGEPSRLYRTGDRCRWLPDGTLEFLGRMDHQVKIRGHRVEPGEVESALRESQIVRDCVVVVHGSEAAEKRLVAYVVLVADAPSIREGALREFLAGRLPAAMIPSAFVPLDAIPLTPTGKVDRLSLPPPSAGHALDHPSALPASPTEEMLLEIWREILHAPGAGIDDDFFQLGGHSLLVVRAAAKIRARCGKPVPLIAFFEDPTVRTLARVLDRIETPKAAHSTVAIRVGSRQPALFCIHPAGGQVTLYSALACHLDPEETVHGMEHPGLRDRSATGLSIAEVARHHLGNLRKCQPIGPYHLCGWSIGGVIAWELATQLEEEGEEVAFLGLIDSTARDPSVPRKLPDAATRCTEFLSAHGIPVEAMGECPDLHVGMELSDDLLARIHAQAVKHGWLPRGFDLEGFLRLHRLYDHLLHEHLTHVPRRGFTGPATLFRRLENVAASNRAAGWDRLGCQLRILDAPGNHESMMEAPHVHVLASIVQACLEAARKGPATNLPPLTPVSECRQPAWPPAPVNQS